MDGDIQKWSDITHAKRSLGGHLHGIKKNNKELRAREIKYFEKQFSYAIKQHKGDPDGVRSPYSLLSLMPIVTTVAVSTYYSHVFRIWISALNPNPRAKKATECCSYLCADMVHCLSQQICRFIPLMLFCS